MAEQIVKLFSADIQKKLFPANAFYQQSKKDMAGDITAKTVQVPQSGTNPTIEVNPSSFPLTAAQRTDDVVEYSLDLLATVPTHLLITEELYTNYNKRADILDAHANTINTRVAEICAVNWAPGVAVNSGANIIRTTGANSSDALAPGATGTRKALTRDDLAVLANMFDKDDVAEGDRNILVPAGLIGQLMKIDSFISNDYKAVGSFVGGQIGEIFGMRVFKRSSAALYEADLTVKPIGDASVVTDHLSILGWATDKVRHAEAAAKVMMEIDKPGYVGSIMNVATVAGASAGRKDYKGVYSLVQDAGA